MGPLRVIKGGAGGEEPPDDGARPEPEPSKRRASSAVVSLLARRRARTWAWPAALLVGIALLIASAMVTRHLAERARIAQGIPIEPMVEASGRAEGGALALQLFALRAGRSIKLSADEVIERTDRLLVVLPAPPRASVLVVLREGTQLSTLYRGPARPGPLPEPFEWKGEATRGELIALYTGASPERPQLLERLRGSPPSSTAAGIAEADEVVVSREVTRR